MGAITEWNRLQILGDAIIHNTVDEIELIAKKISPSVLDWLSQAHNVEFSPVINADRLRAAELLQKYGGQVLEQIFEESNGAERVMQELSDDCNGGPLQARILAPGSIFTAYICQSYIANAAANPEELLPGIICVRGENPEN